LQAERNCSLLEQLSQLCSQVLELNIWELVHRTML
jgi:hypothetical protein